MSVYLNLKVIRSVQCELTVIGDAERYLRVSFNYMSIFPQNCQMLTLPSLRNLGSASADVR